MGDQNQANDVATSLQAILQQLGTITTRLDALEVRNQQEPPPQQRENNAAPNNEQRDQQQQQVQPELEIEDDSLNDAEIIEDL